MTFLRAPSGASIQIFFWGGQNVLFKLSITLSPLFIVIAVEWGTCGGRGACVCVCVFAWVYVWGRTLNYEILQGALFRDCYL